ncbi:MAG: GtrA family protein [Treponema sp.]|jgi:putative flippase GtrA|nr:GtrA family protein [Treponema sp.]
MRIIDKTFVRFIIVGIINTGIGAGLMFILYNLFNVDYWSASAANYIVGSIVSFFLNKYFTFAVKEWNLFMVCAFIVNIAVSYFIAYGLAKPAMHYLLRHSPLKIRENAALFAGMCLFTGLNYLGQRIVDFRKSIDQGGRNDSQS